MKFTLTKPESPFIANLGMDFAAIHSAEYMDADAEGRHAGAGRPEPDRHRPVRAELATSKDDRIIYNANVNYFRGKQPIDRLVFSITPDQATREARLEAGECDVIPYPNPANVAKLKANPNLQVLEQEGLNVGYLAMNVKKPPFDNVKVRQAINMAIDKEAILAAVYQGAGKAAKNPIPPTIWSYDDAVQAYPYDPEKAKAMLAEAGVSDLADRPLVHAGAASVQPGRQEDGRADAGRPREGRHHRRAQDLRVGRVPQAPAGRRAPDGHAGLDRRQRRSGQLHGRAAVLRLRA